MSDKMPAERQIRCLSHFRERFLHFVLAEVDLTRVGRGAHVVGVERLGNSDKADRGRIASRPSGGSRDLVADASQPCSKRCGVYHAESLNWKSEV